jgi:hypothetical protein
MADPLQATGTNLQKCLTLHSGRDEVSSTGLFVKVGFALGLSTNGAN